MGLSQDYLSPDEACTLIDEAGVGLQSAALLLADAELDRAGSDNISVGVRRSMGVHPRSLAGSRLVCVGLS